MYFAADRQEWLTFFWMGRLFAKQYVLKLINNYKIFNKLKFLRFKLK